MKGDPKYHVGDRFWKINIPKVSLQTNRVKAACTLIGQRIRNHFQSKSIIDFLKETHKVNALYHNGALVEDNLIHSFDTEYLTGMHLHTRHSIMNAVLSTSPAMDKYYPRST